MPKNAAPSGSSASDESAKNPTSGSETAAPSRRRVSPALVIVALVLLVVGGFGIMAAIQAEDQPGALFETNEGFGMILGTADPVATLTQPIVLQEGGDVEHEVGHILESLKGARGVARGVVLRDGSAVVITYDPDLQSEEVIVNALREAGYVQ